MNINCRRRNVPGCSFCLLVLALASAPTSGRAQSSDKLYGELTALVLTRADGALVENFREAWLGSGLGETGTERVVLIFVTKEGGLRGKLLRESNLWHKATFVWQPGAIAIAHTHPNRKEQGPSPEDKGVAQKYGVPIFTLAQSGMYVYDPSTKRVSRVQNGTDWAHLSRWKR